MLSRKDYCHVIGDPAGIGLEQRELLFGMPVTIQIPFAERLALRQQVQQGG
jgi:hypothetical protein